METLTVEVRTLAAEINAIKLKLSVYRAHPRMTGKAFTVDVYTTEKN